MDQNIEVLKINIKEKLTSAQYAREICPPAQRDHFETKAATYADVLRMIEEMEAWNNVDKYYS